MAPHDPALREDPAKIRSWKPPPRTPGWNVLDCSLWAKLQKRALDTLGARHRAPDLGSEPPQRRPRSVHHSREEGLRLAAEAHRGHGEREGLPRQGRPRRQVPLEAAMAVLRLGPNRLSGATAFRLGVFRAWRAGSLWLLAPFCFGGWEDACAATRHGRRTRKCHGG